MALFRFGDDRDDMFGQMNRMMNQMMGGVFDDPFGMNPLRPPSMMMSPFNQFNQQMMQFPMMNGGSTFSSSSMISYSSDGRNPPQVYEETNMNHIGPNGLREERHTVRDSRTGLQKMKIGRHIQDRGHVMERSKNHQTGDEEENNEFINIEEEEAPQFQHEFSARMSKAYGGKVGNNYLQGSNRSERLAIEAGPSSSTDFSAPASPSTNIDSNYKPKNKFKPMIMKNKKPKKTPREK